MGMRKVKITGHNSVLIAVTNVPPEQIKSWVTMNKEFGEKYTLRQWLETRASTQCYEFVVVYDFNENTDLSRKLVHDAIGYDEVYDFAYEKKDHGWEGTREKILGIFEDAVTDKGMAVIDRDEESITIRNDDGVSDFLVRIVKD